METREGKKSANKYGVAIEEGGLAKEPRKGQVGGSRNLRRSAGREKK